MNSFLRNKPPIFCTLFLMIFLFVQLSACSSLIKPPSNDNPLEYPKAEVVFQVTVPQAIEKDSKMVLEILDDVTGIYFNSARFEMAQKDDTNYFIRVPLTISSEIKYRYVKVGASSAYEFSSQNQQVRFRIIKISGPEIVQDTVTTWIDQPYSGPLGRIRGQVIDKANNAPIPNLLITAGGLQTISASDGSFILEGLVPGTHNLVIYSMDGAYETFQQGALISDDATTPVLAYLNKRRTVDITFNVNIPEGYDEALPLRFVSNLHNLGNAYADLSSGSSGSSVNYPALQLVSAGHYTLKLTLPIGFYMRYKYSFGDGFWNSELDANGNFVVRELIVEKAGSVNGKVLSFTTADLQPVKIITHVPPGTSAGETIFIQFNPFGWMEPLQMVSDGENTWHYTVYNPLHLLGQIGYRFCRNGQCEIASDTSPEKKQFSSQNQGQTFDETVASWKHLSNSASTFTLVTEGGPSKPPANFIAGVELSPSYSSNWQAFIDQGLAASSGMGSDWVILTPTWTVTRTNPPLIEPVAGNDLLWDEIQNQNSHVILNNQKSMIFPVITYAQSANIFWLSSKRDIGWWNTWFERYHRYILNYADLANILKIDAIVIGDPSLSPSMSGGKLADGSDSGAPSDADGRWRQLVSDIRSRYSGSIIGVASINSDEDLIPGWLDKVDSIYVLFSPSLLVSKNESVKELIHKFDDVINDRVSPIYEEYKKPIIIGVSYPSNEFSPGGIPLSSQFQAFSPFEVKDVPPELEIQAKLYNAAFISAASKDWITGFISRGYYPNVILQDASSSIYGKPAADALWFWYHFILNKAP